MLILSGVVLWVMLVADQLAGQTAQPAVFEFGVRAGVPFQSAAGLQPGVRQNFFVGQQIVTQQNFRRPPVAVGPTFGALIYDRFQFEFGAIYKPVKFDVGIFQQGSCADPLCLQRNPGVTIQQTGRGHLWEFPVTANYFISRTQIRPYVGSGIVISQDLAGRRDFRYTDQVTGNQTLFSGLLGSFIQHWPSPVVDVGFRWTKSAFNIQPEIRYSRHRPSSLLGLEVNPRRNQWDFLLGFSRRMR